MVSVEDLDPPEEAKIKSEPKGVPHGAPPKEELAERASEWGETSADKLPDDHEESTARQQTTRTLTIARKPIFGDSQMVCIRLWQYAS